MTNLVSVIIPAFNSEGTIARAIDSVLTQGCEVEVLVVDDGSTDRTSQRVMDYAGETVRLIRQPNSGPGAARNRGVVEASGAFVTFLDADDWFLPGALNVLLAEQSATGAQCVKASYGIAAPGGAVVPHRLRIPGGLRSDARSVADLRLAFLENAEHCFAHTWLLEAGLAKSLAFPEDLQFMEDVVYLSRALMLTKSATVVDRPVVAYFQGEGSLTRNPRQFARNALAAVTVAERVVRDTQDARMRGRIAGARLSLLAWLMVLGVEDHSVGRAEFRTLLPRLRRSVRASGLRGAAEGHRRGLMAPLSTVLLEPGVPGPVAWAAIKIHALAWHAYKQVRTVLRRVRGARVH